MLLMRLNELSESKMRFHDGLLSFIQKLFEMSQGTQFVLSAMCFYILVLDDKSILGKEINWTE